ncbi:MAG: hypothetical protein AAGH73_12660, partial [Pseudomonadota bacterium]
KRGANTGWHRHEYDYVVIPLFDGALDILNPDGSTTLAPMKNGVPYFRPRPQHRAQAPEALYHELLGLRHDPHPGEHHDDEEDRQNDQEGIVTQKGEEELLEIHVMCP